MVLILDQCLKIDQSQVFELFRIFPLKLDVIRRTLIFKVTSIRKLDILKFQLLQIMSNTMTDKNAITKHFGDVFFYLGQSWCILQPFSPDSMNPVQAVGNLYFRVD